MKKYITSESVTEGHPDKVCDQISDKILDTALSQDKKSKMAVECTIKDNLIFIYGESSTKAKIPYEKIAKEVIKEIGYNEEYEVITKISTQSKEISKAVNKEKISLEVVAKMCNVPTKSLRRWSIVGCSRKKGCGRKIKDPVMEKKLIAWYLNCVNKENLYPTGKMIRAKALELTEIKGFLASKGWLEKFKKKYNVKTYTSKEKKVLLTGNQ